MENKEFIERIRDMIAEGETEKSLDELYEFVRNADNELLDRLVLLRNRMKKLQRDKQTGVLDDDEEYTERAKINESILMFMRQLTPEYMSLSTKEKEKYNPADAEPLRRAPAPAGNMKPVYIGGGAIALVVVLFFLLRGSFGSEPNVNPAPHNNFSSNGANSGSDIVYPKWGEVRTKNKDDLRMRTRADEKSDIVVNMPNGSPVKIIGADENYVRLSNGDYGKWMKVEYRDGAGKVYVGWAWGGYITLTN